jgi:hypothetical protein
MLLVLQQFARDHYYFIYCSKAVLLRPDNKYVKCVINGKYLEERSYTWLQLDMWCRLVEIYDIYELNSILGKIVTVFITVQNIKMKKPEVIRKIKQ